MNAPRVLRLAGGIVCTAGTITLLAGTHQVSSTLIVTGALSVSASLTMFGIAEALDTYNDRKER